MLHAFIYVCIVSTLLSSVVSQVTAPSQYNGEKGAKGEAGAIGPTGSQGVKGSKGLQGAVGATGLVGQKGAKGAVGQSASNAGAIGATGEAGVLGGVGATGQQGVQGLNGEQGTSGLTGLTGEKGSPGSAGATGDIGSKGQKGQRGAQGDRGVTGAKGDSGMPGEPGTRGPTGGNGKLGYPFPYDAATYSDGCLELQGYAGKDCGGAHYCQDIVDATTSEVSGECRCLDGYTLDNRMCKSNWFPTAYRDCTNNNGGCQQICASGGCKCEAGYTLKASGKCIDIDECSRGQHQCHSSHKCLNLLGSYRCLLDPEQLVTDVKAVGGGLVNENTLLALLIWLLLLLLVIVIFLIALCCLAPVKSNVSNPPTITTVEYITPK